MSDITIQNAIHCLKAMICEEVCEECDYYGKTGTDHCEKDAIRMAIEALEARIDIDEWCHECKEFDTKNDCCPRFNRVIRDALKGERHDR